MKRRHLVVLVSAITLLTIVFVAAVTIGVGVGTDAGREQIRALVQHEVNSRVKGKVHIGRVREGGLTELVIDSFAIRDQQDSLLVSTGRVTLHYDVRDLFDRRILLRNVEVEHPVFRLHQYEKGDWNFQRILRRDGPSGPNVPGRSFGDFVVLDSVRVRNGEFILTRPWSPDDSLSGAKRDSAIRRNIANPDREIRRSAEGLTHTYRWSRISGFLPRVRIADPDSNRFGQLFVIDSLRVDEQEPPFKFRNARGVVRKLGDSIFVDAPHFDLPASTGSAQGKIWWGSGLPVRLDIRVKADSVSLNDVAWVYETLPRTGGGRTNLRITNNPQNLRDFQYALTDMDVRSTKSRLTGAMTFVVGGPVLVVKDVDLRAAPVNWDLVRTLAGGPLPEDWQGDLFGIVRGPGGPLTRFVVDTSFVTFRDAHVRGAISQLGGRGMLNILDPELTEFYGFDVHAVSVDLRSLEYLYPGLPRLGGTIAGVATLDSSWMDVRFSKANVTHRNGPGEPTRVTGSGRVTYGEQFLTYDVAVNAQPLSLTMMTRAYPFLGLKGLMSGPIQAKGITNDLQLTMQLEGPAGRFNYTGRVDAYPLSIAARGGGRVDQLDLAQVIDKPKTPAGFVTGSYQLDVRGDTNDLGTLKGTASMLVERSELDGIRIFPSRLRARFADGRMYVDTLLVESVAARVTARGAIGLTRITSDSIRYEIAVDSLGGVRRYVTPLLARRAENGDADSLSGSVILAGTARGSLRSLGLSGTLTGTNVFVRREAGREISGEFSLANILESPTGTISVRFNDLNVGGIAIDTLGAQVRLGAARSGDFTLGALAINGVRLLVAGDLALADASTEIRLNTLALATDSSRWTLRGPASVRLQRSKAVAIDSLVLTNGRGGRAALVGVVPDSGQVRLGFRADSVPLRDIGQIAQLRAPLEGVAHLTVVGIGTATAPVMNLQARLNNLQYRTIRLDRVNATADYANRRAQVALDLVSGGRTALVARGSLPLEVSYFGALLLDDSLSATVRTDSASFSLVEALIPGLSSATGRLVATLDIGGTWKHPDVSGPVRVENGEVTVDSLGIRVRGVNVDVGFFGHRDSLAIRRMVGWSGMTSADSVSLSGYVAYRDLSNPYLALRLRARNFHVLDKRSVARLDVSTEGSGLQLRGQLRGGTLTGGIVVDGGVIYLPDPELARKEYADFTSLLRDTSSARVRRATSDLFESILFDDVRVTIGDEVRLQSREANIVLAGTLNVQRRMRRSLVVTATGVETDSALVPVLEGELRAVRGTYTLEPIPLLPREFQVEGGVISFFGTEDPKEAQLDIRALHVVRAAAGGERRIRVHLAGTVNDPSVTLESGESFQMSQSDMVSYLIFGQPNFALGSESRDYVQQGLQILYPTATTFAAAQLRGFLGGAADLFQIRAGSTDLSKFGESGFGAFGRETIEDVLWTSRIGGEKQITQNLFVSLSTGLCAFQRSQPSAASQDLGLVEGLSGKLEYRLSRDASVKVGKEPATSTCRGSSSGRVVQAPSQWGLSLFKTWRF